MKKIISQFILWLLMFLGIFLTPLFWLHSWMNAQVQQFILSFSDLTLMLAQRAVQALHLPIGQTLHQLFGGVLMGTGFLILPWAIIVSYMLYRLVVLVWRKYAH